MPVPHERHRGASVRLPGGELGILTARLGVPFSLHQVNIRKKMELSTESKLSMECLEGRPHKENAE